jgi:hypothetical protein
MEYVATVPDLKEKAIKHTRTACLPSRTKRAKQTLIKGTPHVETGLNGNLTTEWGRGNRLTY